MKDSREKRGWFRRSPPSAREDDPAPRRNAAARPEIETSLGGTLARYLIEFSFDLILLVDRGGMILYVSPSAERMLGYKPSEVLGTRVFDYVHPEDMNRALDFYYSRVDREGFSRYTYFRVRHQDGSWHDMEAIGSNLLQDPVVKGIIINARDISEKKELEEELQRSEEYFRSLTESTSDIITVLDADGNILYVSPSVERAAGYRPEEIVGKKLLDLAHPDDVSGSEESFAYALQREGVTRYAEFRMQHRDGTWHYYEAAANNLLDNPVVQGIVVHTRDVTERKQWEEAVRESEEKYRLIYDFTGEAIYTYDTGFNLIGVNKRACELIGYEEQEILGRNILELNILHPDDYERTLQDIQRLHGGEVVNDELRFVRKDGSVAIGDITGAPLYNREGKIIAFTNVARDITESKRAELRLDRFNRCMLELGPDPLENIRNIALAGADIMEGHGLLYARLDKGRLYVFSPERPGQGFVIQDNPEDYISYGLIRSGEESACMITEIDEEGYANDPFAAATGSRSFLAYPTRLGGKTVGSLCLYGRGPGAFDQEDMHFMGMLSRALTIEEERLSHEESIRHFVDIASHELRTPLSIIKGYADAFQFGDLMEMSDLQLDKMRIINAKADKMAKTINDLLDLSRIERGHFTVEKGTVELQHLIRTAVSQMREKGSGNDFSITLAEGVSEVEADAEKLVDALLILLDNAVNYSPAASDIQIEVGPGDGGAVFSVLDRGSGVPEKDRVSIFERFYQLEDSRHHSASGMGLGLYIASEIVRSHGGTIWYEPREGGGSVFSFSIP